jgi:hypothetical protein
VEVTAASSSYTSMVIGARSHKLQPLFNLVFRRSNIQHPLLMGALSEWRLAHMAVWLLGPCYVDWHQCFSTSMCRRAIDGALLQHCHAKKSTVLRTHTVCAIFEAAGA